MNYFSFHTHSHYCDGKHAPVEYVKRAIELGMESVGFSSHAPLLDEVVWAIKENQMSDYLMDIRSLKEEYKYEMPVYLSLELDYLPGVSKSFEEWKERACLDYTIGSVHLVKGNSSDEFWFLDGPDVNYIHGLEVLFDGDIKKAVTAYYHQVNEMILTQKPDIVGHIDKVKMNNKDRYFTEGESWYVQLMDETLNILKESNSIVEVNTRGLYTGKSDKLYPDDYFLEQCCKLGIPVTISTDAHHPDQLIAEFESTRARLKAMGFSEIQTFRKGEWQRQMI